MFSRRGADPRSGFIMMFTLVAVALAGLVMVETAPDFSNYAVLARGEEFDRNLSLLRQVVAAHPFALTTADTIDPMNPTTGVLTPDDLLDCLTQYVVPDGATVSASSVVLATVPRDPYVPYRDWLRADNPQAKFWSASYNTIGNPSFYLGSREEAYLDRAFSLFYVKSRDGADTSRRIYLTDRFGYHNEQVCYQGNAAIIRNCEMSPDGAAITFQSSEFGADNIFVVGTTSFVPYPVTDSRRYTSGGPYSFVDPTWSADGRRIACVRIGPTRQDILITLPLKDDPASPVAVGASFITTTCTPAPTAITGLAWSPPSSDLSFQGRSRYLAFTFTAGGVERLGLYDVKDNRHIIPESGTVEFPCTGGRPVWTTISGGPTDPRRHDCLLFIGPGANRPVIVLHYPGRYASGVTTVTDDEDTGIDDVAEMTVIPAAASLSNEGNWLLYRRASDNRLCKAEILPASGAPGTKEPRLLYPDPILPGFRPTVSHRGTRTAFVAASGRDIYSLDTDGGSLRLIRTETEDIHEILFSGITPTWVGPAPEGAGSSFANVQIISPAIADTRSYVDADNWRAFLGQNLDFPGDFKFASAWLRLNPPENQGQLLFDNGMKIFRVDVNAPTLRPDAGTVSFMGKIDPAWSWQGATYIAKEAVDPTGGEPADLFKQAFRAATTVILGQGYNPDLSPNDRDFAYSFHQSTVSTYPPDSTTFPIDNMDIFVSNTGGAPEPPPLNITPDTPDSFESEPAFSPDGRYVYFTRQKQYYGWYLYSHESSICRVTARGGVATVIQPSGSITADWREGWTSQVEFYHPSVSPDGSRLAFVGKERLTGDGGVLNIDPVADDYAVGDIITEILYVKDILYKAKPVPLLRTVCGEPDFAAFTTRYEPVGGTDLENCSITNLSWTPNGEEILATISYPMNRKFPKCIDERGSTDTEQALRPSYHDQCTESLVLAVPVSISHFEVGVNAREFPSGDLDPPGFEHADSPPQYRVILQSRTGGAITSADATRVPDFGAPLPPPAPPLAHQKIFNAVHSKSAYCFQRVETDSAFFNSNGFSLGTWYILSGFVRTSLSVEDLHAAQMMVQLFNSKGTLVALQANPQLAKVYQVGYPDIGATQWTRFSAAIMFDDAGFQPDRKDTPPYSINLVLSTSGKHGSWAEFTGLKLEKSFDSRYNRPTRFAPGWILFSSSLEADPRDPGSLLFER